MGKDWEDNTFVHHWQHYKPPARASPSDLKFIERKILEKGKTAKVLILGSTPEYRNLCGKLNMNVTVLDFSKYNQEYLLREVQMQPNETFVEGNWLTTRLNEKFDIILGDNVVNVISKNDVPQLFSNISRMLEKDGYFLPRTYVRDANERISIEASLKVSRSHKKSSIFTWLGRDLYVLGYDFDKDCLIMKDIWQVVVDLFNKKSITEEELDELRNLSWENREFSFYIPLKEDLNLLISQFFDIIEVFYGKEDYLKDKFPLHVLKLKQNK